MPSILVRNQLAKLTVKPFEYVLLRERQAVKTVKLDEVGSLKGDARDHAKLHRLTNSSTSSPHLSEHAHGHTTAAEAQEQPEAQGRQVRWPGLAALRAAIAQRRQARSQLGFPRLGRPPSPAGLLALAVLSAMSADVLLHELVDLSSLAAQGRMRHLLARRQRMVGRLPCTHDRWLPHARGGLGAQQPQHVLDQVRSLVGVHRATVSVVPQRLQRQVLPPTAHLRLDVRMAACRVHSLPHPQPPGEIRHARGHDPEALGAAHVPRIVGLRVQVIRLPCILPPRQLDGGDAAVRGPRRSRRGRRCGGAEKKCDARQQRARRQRRRRPARPVPAPHGPCSTMVRGAKSLATTCSSQT
mmetsp:Transcript_104832/g.296622  ORF Transcript_104832/g.296622 Transcript_104832/m.296622 type:complete len:355 (+) Transcript_104832:333-1397(+)